MFMIHFNYNIYFENSSSISNFLILLRFLVLAVVKNPELLNFCIWHLHQLFTSGRVTYTALSTPIILAVMVVFMAPSLRVSWAHDKLRKNNKSMVGRSPSCITGPGVAQVSLSYAKSRQPHILKTRLTFIPDSLTHIRDGTCKLNVLRRTRNRQYKNYL